MRKPKITRERDGREIRKAMSLGMELRKREKEWAVLVKAQSDLNKEMTESDRRYRKAKYDFKANINLDEMFHDIEGLIRAIYGHTIEEIRGNTRPRTLVDCRRALSHVMIHVFGLNLQKYGRHVNRDHSTIIHHLKTHEGIMESDTVYRRNFGKLMAGIAAMSIDLETC